MTDRPEPKPYETARCPSCHDHFRVTKGGVIREHDQVTSTFMGRMECPGSGKDPEAVVKRWIR